MTYRLRFALLIYRLLWWLVLPLVLFYLRRRAKRDPAYGEHMEERWGHGQTLENSVWVHAVSLGEMRSAAPLVRALLDRGEKVVTTHITPAGRHAAEKLFPEAIANGTLIARYLPFELGPAYCRFLKATRPKLALVLEVEIWPVMIAEAQRAKIPLYLVNSQIPSKSFPRARRLAHFIGHPVAAVTGVLAKSEHHVDRFLKLGATNVLAAGELRFDQPIPKLLLSAAAQLRPKIHRPVVAVASVVEGEDELYLETYRLLQKRFRENGQTPPLFIHIPRAPERFKIAGDFLASQGQALIRRSESFTADLAATKIDINETDVLVGDSIGEMYFYLALSDVAVVGGGFLPSGAHNIIEPLALKKPVLTGPNIWTIEYPANEALEAGVLRLCDDPTDLANEIESILSQPDDFTLKADAFFAAHAGATERIMKHIDPILSTNKNLSP